MKEQERTQGMDSLKAMLVMFKFERDHNEELTRLIDEINKSANSTAGGN